MMSTDRKRVLFVDDVKLSIEMGREMLAETGCEILTASNGVEALEILKDETPDLIMIDLFMPEMNGDECCRIIKAKPDLSHIPVIMVTAIDREENLDKCYDAGCDNIVIKPLRRDDVLEKVNKYLLNI